jgi:hypothetical protein
VKQDCTQVGHCHRLLLLESPIGVLRKRFALRGASLAHAAEQPSASRPDAQRGDAQPTAVTFDERMVR